MEGQTGDNSFFFHALANLCVCVGVGYFLSESVRSFRCHISTAAVPSCGPFINQACRILDRPRDWSVEDESRKQIKY